MPYAARVQAALQKYPPPVDDALVPIARAIVASGRALFTHAGAEAMAKQLYPTDRAVHALVTRAATIPADSSTVGWAASLATVKVANVILGLGPTSAAAELFARALGVSFGRSAKVYVPSVVATATGASFVAEGAPIPVREDPLDGVTLERRKLAVIFVLTREVMEASNAAAVVRQTAAEHLAAALDAAVFSTTEGDTVTPSGLLFGVNATAATAGGGTAAMLMDIGNLVGAVAAVGGTQVTLVAAPSEWAKIVVQAPALPFPVLPSGALTAGTVVAVAASALAAATGDTPEYATSAHAVLHMDTAPAAIGTEGDPGPNTVAAPARSLWQSDAVGIRLVLRLGWGLRVTSGAPVAWTESVTW
jgi:hypothetical protein